MNSSRLAELERQRALVREQLAWLEREIAREADSNPAAPAGAPVGRPLADAPVALAGSGSKARSGSELAAYATTQPTLQASAFDEYQPDPKNAAENARKGCLYAALAVFLFLVTAFVALYFYRYSDRPLLFPSHADAPAKK